jgi:5,10-methylenetetrahydromethanopterin reductase
MPATLGVNLMAVDPPQAFVNCVKYVDGVGFSHMFVADSSLHGRDVFPYLTLLAMHSSTVRIGPLVLHPYSRHPAVNLNALATVNEIAGGRVIANMGAGGRPVRELGVPMAKTKGVRDAVAAMRQLLSGQAVDFQGDSFRLEHASLRFGQWKDMPLYVTASGPRMLELAGEMADGVLFMSGLDARCVQFALDHIASGARRRGRNLRDLVIGCCIYGALDDDVARARETCRPIAAWLPQAVPEYATCIGVPPSRIDDMRNAKRVYGGHHFDEAREAFKLVTDDMVDAFSMPGDARTWIERMKRVETLGIDLFVVFPMMADRIGMIHRLGRDVLPEFRAR